MQPMPRIRIRSLVVAMAALALTAGFAAAQVLPAASNAGIDRARSASGQTVPLGAGASNANSTTDASSNTDTGTPATDTHGATVSAAAQGATPAGDWKNHGAYVSSIATGWGQQTADAHKNAAASGANPPAAADTGLAHRP
jgi:hypothetical protein